MLIAAAGAATSQALTAQQGQGVNGSRPSVFLDCASRNCNSNYFRTELPWVNWVRVPESSDVHVIMTSQRTGAGGQEYQFDFMGNGDSAYEYQLLFQSLPTDTDREILDGLAHTIGVGLLHFATANGFHSVARIVELDEEGIDPEERVVAGEEVDDAWNFWVFRLGGRAEIDGEKTRRTKAINGNMSASRVTPTWKMNFRGNVNFNRREIDLVDDPTFIDQRTDWGLSELIAYSLAGHWSVGVQGEIRKITRFNQDLRAELTPALEYSFFPYEEATRRALTVFYKVGPAYRTRLPAILSISGRDRFRASQRNALGAFYRDRTLPAPAVGRRFHQSHGVALPPRHEPVQRVHGGGHRLSHCPGREHQRRGQHLLGQ